MAVNAHASAAAPPPKTCGRFARMLLDRSVSLPSGLLAAQRCECDACLLGLSDDSDSPTQPSPLRSWRKVRNVFLLTPFFQHCKNKHYPWIQLAGHQDNFRAGHSVGTILKKNCTREAKCLIELMDDPLREFAPLFYRELDVDGTKFVEMEDLLFAFETPSCMDCKIGTRTYLETELNKAREDPEPRPDMFDKMIEVDPAEPTAAERAVRAVTKVRYMQWRETTSSTAALGFRIDGIRKSGGGSVNTKDLKTMKNWADLKDCFAHFTSSDARVILIGSSLLFVHDEVTVGRPARAAAASSDSSSDNAPVAGVGGAGAQAAEDADADVRACVWMIDFGKTVRLPDKLAVTHEADWVEGNHEDGYLVGLRSLVRMLEELHREIPASAPSNSNSNANA